MNKDRDFSNPKLSMVLNFVEPRVGGCSAGDVAISLELNRHSALSYLRQLTKLGYLERLPHKRYRFKRS